MQYWSVRSVMITASLYISPTVVTTKKDGYFLRYFSIHL